ITGFHNHCFELIELFCHQSHGPQVSLNFQGPRFSNHGIPCLWQGTGGSRRRWKAPQHPTPRESQSYPCLDGCHRSLDLFPTLCRGYTKNPSKSLTFAPCPPGDALCAAEGWLPAQGPPRAPQPLVLLLDAALTGELEVVQQAVKEMNDPSQPNEEGITALHNAICGANYSIVDFLITTGANVNSPDSHGWTPLHCAASCNDTVICMALVQHGAAIFATTLSDGATAFEKCDPYREGYADCATYLAALPQGEASKE
uniref:Uncharacterized protein n=1 Tax=Macaca fascicularis TaxID=9541 RepID=A0A7N9D3G4_MACFA